MLELIHKIWQRCPDLRLTQLLENTGMTKYYVEDDVLEKALKDTYKDVLKLVSIEKSAKTKKENEKVNDWVRDHIG